MVAIIVQLAELDEVLENIGLCLRFRGPNLNEENYGTDWQIERLLNHRAALYARRANCDLHPISQF